MSMIIIQPFGRIATHIRELYRQETLTCRHTEQQRLSPAASRFSAVMLVFGRFSTVSIASPPVLSVAKRSKFSMEGRLAALICTSNEISIHWHGQLLDCSSVRSRYLTLYCALHRWVDLFPDNSSAQEATDYVDLHKTRSVDVMIRWFYDKPLRIEPVKELETHHIQKAPNSGLPGVPQIERWFDSFDSENRPRDSSDSGSSQ